MRDFRFRLLQDAQFIVVEPNAMCQDNMRRGESYGIQIADVAKPRALFDQRDFVAVFGRVGVNQHAAFTRQPGDLFQ